MGVVLTYGAVGDDVDVLRERASVAAAAEAKVAAVADVKVDRAGAVDVKVDRAVHPRFTGLMFLHTPMTS
jgi:hypothetical protein